MNGWSGYRPAPRKAAGRVGCWRGGCSLTRFGDDPFGLDCFPDVPLPGNRVEAPLPPGDLGRGDYSVIANRVVPRWVKDRVEAGTIEDDVVGHRCLPSHLDRVPGGTGDSRPVGFEVVDDLLESLH